MYHQDDYPDIHEYIRIALLQRLKTSSDLPFSGDPAMVNRSINKDTFLRSTLFHIHVYLDNRLGSTWSIMEIGLEQRGTLRTVGHLSSRPYDTPEVDTEKCDSHQ